MEQEPANDVGIAMVALREREVDPAAIVKALRDDFGIESVVAKSGEPLVLAIEGGEAFVATLPVPLPRRELEEACGRSWQWQDAAKAMGEHTAHAVITVTSPPGTPRLEQALRLSRVASAVASTGQAIGVFWPSAGLVHEPADFLDEVGSASDEYVPAMLWVSLSPFMNKGKRHMATSGLETFGHSEIEAELEGPLADRLLEFLPDLIAHVIISNVKLEDGNTIGGSDTEKFRVRRKKSLLRGDSQVLFVAAGG